MGVSKKICFVIAIVLGLAIAIIGGAILGALPTITNAKLEKELPIEPDTEAGNRFIKSPVPTYMIFYLFNVTNKDEVNNKGDKPKLQEIGPFVYRQEKEKIGVAWYPLNGTVSYKENTRYFYEPEVSNGNLQGSINHLNIFPIALRYSKVLQQVINFVGIKVDDIMKDYTVPLIVTHTVDQLLFAGYNSLENIPSSANLDLVKAFCGMDATCKTVGFFYGRNDTDTEVYNIYTGVKGLKNFTNVYTYGYERELSKYWHGKTCKAINGTDGKQFPPGVDKDEPVYAFSTDICRSMKFVYKKDVTVKEIDALRYYVPEYVFEDPNKNKDNMCFCENVTAGGKCPMAGKGVLPIFECQGDKPIAVSSPHFYFAEPDFVSNFEGLSPREEYHETFLDIEPITGMVISGGKRLQMNFALEPYEHLSMLKNIKKLTYWPLFWLEEGGIIDDKNAKEFIEKVSNPYNTAKWSAVGVLILGGVVVLLAIVIAIFKGCS